jgi:hypothetical protein
MKNLYAGMCYRCGKRVEPNEGLAEIATAERARVWGGRGYIPGLWLVQHMECARQWAGTARHYRFNPVTESAAPPPLQSVCPADPADTEIPES